MTHADSSQEHTGEFSNEPPPGITYDLNDKPPPLRFFLFSTQHVMVGFATIIGVPLAFSAIVELSAREQSTLISGVMIAGGVVTILQSLGLGPIGGRLPLLNSTTFKFLGPLTVAYKFGGFGAVAGATIISGTVTSILGLFVGRVQRIFTPFVIGAFLIITGTSLMPIALRNLLSLGSPYEGTPSALITGGVTLIVMIGLGIVTKPALRMVRALSVLIGFAVGYALAAAVGMINWGSVSAAPWVAFARPFPLDLPSWPTLGITIAVTAVFISIMVESAGDATAVSAILGRKLSPRNLSGTVVADGLSGPISAFFGGLPMTTFGQNVGLVRLTGVGSRYVVAGAGVLLIVLGFIPKIAAVISAMPSSVLGAALVMTFGMIAAEGVYRAGPYLGDARNTVVLSLGLVPAVSLGTIPPEFFGELPLVLAPILTDPLVSGLLIVMVAHLLLPGGRRLERQTSTPAMDASEGSL